MKKKWLDKNVAEMIIALSNILHDQERKIVIAKMLNQIVDKIRGRP
jgi:hypothetical protein